MIPILYVDEQMVVCVKPAGVVSQDAGENSMPQLLARQLGVKTVYPIHRLDREVGGVMVYALTQASASALSRAAQERRLNKVYLAVLSGTPEAPSAVLQDLLFHDKQKNKTYVVSRTRKGVKDASLDYQVLEQAGEWSLVRIQLHTGRTHQIRVQFASRKLPLVGDGKYGGKASGVGLGLWSWQLEFPHPKTGKTMKFRQDPPEYAPWNEFTAEKCLLALETE